MYPLQNLLYEFNENFKKSWKGIIAFKIANKNSLCRYNQLCRFWLQKETSPLLKYWRGLIFAFRFQPFQ